MAGNPYLPETGGLTDEIASMKRDIAALQLSAQLISASIGAGGLSIKGGAVNLYNSSDVLLAVLDALGLTFKETDGSDLLVVDGSKLRYNRADGSRQLEVTPAGGLKIYAANGTTEKVVLDADGLEVDGGMVRAADLQMDSEGFADLSLTTSFMTGASIDFTIPAWVNTVYVLAMAALQITNGSGGVQGALPLIRVEGTIIGIAPIQDVANGEIGASTAHGVTSLARPGDGVVTVEFRAKVTVGTNNSNDSRLSVFLLGLR